MRIPSQGSLKTISQHGHFWARKRATVGDRRLDVFQSYIQGEFRRNAHTFDHFRGTVAEPKISWRRTKALRGWVLHSAP